MTFLSVCELVTGVGPARYDAILSRSFPAAGGVVALTSRHHSEQLCGIRTMTVIANADFRVGHGARVQSADLCRRWRGGITIVGVNELSSARTALAALSPVAVGIGHDQLHLSTPCPGFDVAALADHLVGTITMVGAAAGSDVSAPDTDGIGMRITQTAESVIDVWRRRGTEGEVVFAGRTMAAGLALGVLSVELVVHGWDLAQALGEHVLIAAAHADIVLGLARQIITDESRVTAGFDPPVPVTDDVAAMDRLLAFTGRRPWHL